MAVAARGLSRVGREKRVGDAVVGLRGGVGIAHQQRTPHGRIIATWINRGWFPNGGRGSNRGVRRATRARNTAQVDGAQGLGEASELAVVGVEQAGAGSGSDGAATHNRGLRADLDSVKVAELARVALNPLFGE